MKIQLEVILIFVYVVVLSGCSGATHPQEPMSGSDGQLIGGDQDEHGCLVGAGYSWCEELNKCVRSWEEPCQKDAKNGNEQNVEEQKSCSTDSDCIPLPSDCHPHTCVNKGFELMFAPPDSCTQEFDCAAAYKPEDCSCQDGKCANENEGNQCN